MLDTDTKRRPRRDRQLPPAHPRPALSRRGEKEPCRGGIAIRPYP